MIGTLTHRQSDDRAVALIFKHILSIFLRFYFFMTIRRLLATSDGKLGLSDNSFDNFMSLFNFIYGLGFTIFLLGFIVFFLFFLRFPLNLDQSLFTACIEVLMVEVTLFAVLTYFVKVIHIKLSKIRITCRTKDE
jgi:hypothetical protein